MPRLEDHEETEARNAAAVAGRRPRGKAALKLALEVALIGTGVFLGLAGEQWRESAHRRELADLALRRFREELVANRGAVAAVADYHVTTKRALDAYLAASAATRPQTHVRISGLQPVFFQHTAWDLALATQSLAYIDPELAFSLSRIYGIQQAYAELTRGMMNAMYLRTPTENFRAFAEAAGVYYGDIDLMEPTLLRLYDDALPRIERALGESPTAVGASGRRAASR